MHNTKSPTPTPPHRGTACAVVGRALVVGAVGVPRDAADGQDLPFKIGNLDGARAAGNRLVGRHRDREEKGVAAAGSNGRKLGLQRLGLGKDEHSGDEFKRVHSIA